MSDNPAAMNYAAVAFACKDLDDLSLNAHYTMALSGFGDTKRLRGYETIKHLYTENDGTEMHAAIKEAFILVCRKRLGF